MISRVSTPSGAADRPSRRSTSGATRAGGTRRRSRSLCGLTGFLLRDVFNTGLPYPGVPDAGIFGTQPVLQMQVVPSDHYGVYVKLDFDRQKLKG